MANSEILSLYIKKLNHPLQEIRERSLQLLTAKLKLGWELNDELSGTRELLEALLAWFNTPQPSLQREALELLFNSIKTKAGTYIAKEFGISYILSNLNKIKHKIANDAIEIYDDLLETLRFINTVESDCNLDVTLPRLILPEGNSSESDDRSSSGYYNLGQNCQSSSVSSESDVNSRANINTSESVRILLYPWVDLCKSDKKTLLLVEDALRLLKSTRRCCRFIRDVFLRDFPPEIFLNRPEIIKHLYTISDGHAGGRPGEAMFVLLSVTRSLRSRISQLSSFDLIHETNKISDEFKDIDDDVNIELQEIAGETNLRTPLVDDRLVSLRQLPAPVYALDTMHMVLSIMARNVVLVDPINNIELLDLRELNRCLCLVEKLIALLLDCINPNFWHMDHSTKTYRDISHKSCMVMRLLGDVLVKYRESFLKDLNRTHHRLTWLRLVMCAQRLLHWAKDSALPPTTLVTALQLAQLDPAIDLFYPELSKNIEMVLQNTRIAVNQEYKSKYRELQKLFTSMDEAVQFVKNKTPHSSKTILPCIRNLLPVLELFQNENLLYEISDILIKKTRYMDLNESDWTLARSIALILMSHNLSWVQATFYQLLADMVKSILVGDDNYQTDNEKCLTLLCDVGILTELCCHGLSSKIKEVEESASDIMLYILRGRLVLSENCWWKLLASLLPILPLLHVYAAHETQLGKAICKCLDRDIADCMGVSRVDVIAGLVRLLFVKCVAVQLDAAHTLCRCLDDDRYLPPKESLRADILLSALRRVEPQEFNVDLSSSPSKTSQTGGLIQILDVLKQDIILDENDDFVARRNVQPVLDPSLRRSTLQQLAVLMRQQDQHDTFIQTDGVKLIVATLRMSLLVDDYFAFPECAISCVSILNSVCFASRHYLSKIPDLPSLLLRVILVFPANDSCVLMTSQTLGLVSWAGFALQELDSSRHRIPALPLCVTQRTTLPFSIHSYWNTSPNAAHSYVEWLLTEEEWRTAIRVRWWCVHSGRSRLLSGAPPAGPLALRPTPQDLAALRAACPLYSCTKALQDLQNATTHKQVIESLHNLESYVHLVPSANVCKKEFSSLPWTHTKRFLCSPPASSRDTTLLCTLLHFVIAYMDNVPNTDGTMSWILSSFIGNDADIICLLSRHELYPEQTVQESIEITQLHINIVKVLLRCIIVWEKADCDVRRLESLIKILLACLDKIDLKNFHMLGYLNELMRCIKYALNSRHCKLSEDVLIHCLKLISRTMVCCASGNGCKGQACRLDATLSMLTLLRQIHKEDIPVQRWCELFNTDVIDAIVKSARAGRVELRAAAIHVIAALAYYAQMQPHLLQAVQESSLSEFATQVFCHSGEANVVRAASASLLTSITSRASSRSDVLESDVLQQLNEYHFVERCLEILVDFCNAKEYNRTFRPNVSVSMLERRSELEVRAQKGGEVYVSQISAGQPAPPTASLITSIANALHNISAFTNCPIQQWSEKGLYRLLFRCCSWSGETVRDTHEVRAASCRALLAVSSHKCVRASLAATNDCLHNLLLTLTAFDQDDMERECLESRAQGLSLLASILGERSAADNVWRMFTDIHADQFFYLLLQCLEYDEIELQDAALYCLTQLAQSMTNKRHADKSKEIRAELYDHLKSPYWHGGPNQRAGAGDSARSRDCQPEFIAEELCKALIDLFQKLSMENRHQASQDERWLRVCSCVASVLSVSARSRQYAVHRQFARLLLCSLQSVRDHLSLHGKPADLIRNTNNNPVLRTLFWLLTVIDCSMLNCTAAKESFADENIATNLIKLWPWCMMTEQLRHAVVHLLYTFTNDCSKVSACMSACTGGRTLTAELCALTSREVREVRSAARSAPLLWSLHALARLAANHHCRSIILKSECMLSMHRACMRARVSGWGHAGSAWARLCEAVARHADGAATLLALRAGAASPAAAPQHTRSLLLPAIAHAAHHHRQTFLQTSELLELLCDTLLAGDMAEIVSAARAVWALAANNHKAKLVLRSAGVTTAVHSTLQRLQKMRGDDEQTQRATHLLMYTNTVLHTA